MPNHVTTICTVTGAADDLQAFATWFAEGFSFERIIPMPEVVRNTESSTDATLGYYALHGRFPPSERRSVLTGGRMTLRNFGCVPSEITTQEQLKAWLRPRALEQGAKSYAAECETGFANWYDWASARWGTKWDAYDVETREVSAERVVFKFETAWCFPKPIFYRLRQMFPALVFDVASYDEGGKFGCVGQWGGLNDFRHVEVTDELYERVYGHKRELDDDSQDDSEDEDAA